MATELSTAVKKILALAEQEAKDRHRHYVGIEHIDTAILLHGEGVAYEVLSEMGLTVDRVRRRSEALTMGDPPAPHPTPPEYTDRAQLLLTTLVPEQAAKLGDAVADTHHLLLAILAQPFSVGVQILIAELGTRDAVRAKVYERLAA